MSRGGFALYAGRFMRIVLYLMLPLLLLLTVALPFSIVFCGDYEAARKTIVADYLWDDDALLKKHIFSTTPGLHFMADRYGAPEFESLEMFEACKSPLSVFARHAEAAGLRFDGMPAAERDYNDYKNFISAEWLYVPESVAGRLFPVYLKERYMMQAEDILFQLKSSRDVPSWVKKNYPEETDRAVLFDSLELLALAVMNNEMGSAYMKFGEVPVPVQPVLRDPRWIQPADMHWDLWSGFVKSLPCSAKWMPTLEVYWRSFLRKRYSGDIDRLNREWSLYCTGFSEVAVPGKDERVSDPARKAWSEFVLTFYPRKLLRLPDGYDEQWRRYLKTRFGDGQGMLGQLLVESGEVKNSIRLPVRRPDDPALDALWCDFVESGTIPAADIVLITHEAGFGEFLRSGYLAGSIVSLNEEWHTGFSDFSQVPVPLSLSDMTLLASDADLLRRNYAWSAWMSAMESLEDRPDVIGRTIKSVSLPVACSLLVSCVLGYLLARVPVRAASRYILICTAASLVPLSSCLSGNLPDLVSSLSQGGALIAVLMCGSCFSVALFRNWFLRIIKRYRDTACMDGVGEWSFFFRFAARYSLPVILYAMFLHFVLFYCASDWQLLVHGRLWSWTAAVWAVDQGALQPQVQAAVAAAGMLPVLAAVCICFPVLNRYCITVME